MNNLIAISGNSGSGKSLVSCAISNEITRKYKKSVIVINPNKVTPMLPVYLPLQTFERNNSLGDLFFNGISYQNLKGKLHIHSKNSNLAFMGYISTDNILRYNSDISKDEISKLLNLLSDGSENAFCDYIIVDCNSDVTGCNLSLFAINNAFANIKVISPDNNGVSYLTSQEQFIQSPGAKNITVLNNCYDYSPVDVLKKELNINITLPHCKSAYEHYLSGGNFHFNFNETSKEFTSSIEKIITSFLEVKNE